MLPKKLKGSIYARYNYWLNKDLDHKGVQAYSYSSAYKKAKELVSNACKEGDILTVKWCMGTYTENYVQKFLRRKNKWVKIDF